MAGTNFDLASAKRIVAAVKTLEAQRRNLTGQSAPSWPVETSFWAMLTGVDTTGRLYDWVAVQPNQSAMATPSDSNILATNMWSYREPYVAGWQCAREANDNRGVPNGSVVMLNFMGYGQASVAPSGSVSPSGSSQLSGVSTIEGSGPLVSDDGKVPFYAFNYAVPDEYQIPMHDHRDNFSGGFSFSVFHPGTSVSQQPFAI